MSEKIRLFLILLALAFAASLSARAATTDSLYEPATARKIDPAQQSMLGPQSGSFRYDGRMIRAAEIASSRAKKHSTSRCWRYVKDALLAAKIVKSRPVTAYARQAAAE